MNIPSIGRRWQVVLPVKRSTSSKSRLRGGRLSDRARADLALAFALDTALAALACPRVARVLTVTEDETVSARMSDLGAVVIPEPPAGAIRGFARLNAAIELAVRASDSLQVPVCALTADLPALRPEELDEALALAADHPRAFVPDHTGEGTALLSALVGARLAPAFGERSALRHEASGAVRLPVTSAGLRRDVDFEGDLDAARRLGVGPHTSRALEGATPLEDDLPRRRLDEIPGTLHQS